MNECKHKWIFQETQKGVYTKGDWYGNHTAYYTRIDVYYCENCCEIKEIKKEAIIELPSGSQRDLKCHAPIWWQ